MRINMPLVSENQTAQLNLTLGLEEKLNKLRAIMHECDSVLVAYSGGVDSALVMAVAHRELGERALACIGVSPSYPTREMRDAVKLAEQIGVPYRLVNTTEYLDANYAANPTNRCYFCKSELHDQLKKVANEEGWQMVLDGNNSSDLGDYRPGMAAARERGVRSPLIEANVSKAEVRELAHYLGLPVWDKPAMACLSSRVPHGTAITPELLRQIESAEDVLVDLGFRQFRVRHHNELARIELPAEDFPQALAQHTALLTGIRAAGYRFVTLDLAGFRSGSLNGASSAVIPLAAVLGA